MFIAKCSLRHAQFSFSGKICFLLCIKEQGKNNYVLIQQHFFSILKEKYLSYFRLLRKFLL